MADPASRKSARLNRLRSRLRRKRESLADHFDFRMYVAFVFKDKKKKSALFELTDVVPVMTNNYEESILKGVQEEVYTLESSQELLGKDIVQLHAARFQSMRKDVIGCVQDIDFLLWPRKDIEKIVCLLFSRWKGDGDSEFRPVQAKFEFEHLDYEKQLLKLLSKKDHHGLIINNPSESMFIFVNRHHWKSPQTKAVVFKISSICLYLPQNELTHWGSELADDVLAPYMPG